MKVQFENPPVNELVIATYFSSPLPDFRNEHIGLFWSKVRDKFPKIKQQGPTGSAEVLSPIGNELFPMPRYQFISDDESNLLQVQKNAFVFNWVRRDGDYPNFHKNLKPSFDRYFSVFSEFVRQEVGVADLNIDLCELSYLDVIKPCDYWSGPEDTPSVLPFVRFPDAETKEGRLSAFNCTYSFVESDDLQLIVSPRSGLSGPDPALVMEFKASQRLGQASKSEADSWFDRAHDAIISRFLNITSGDIQRDHWKLVEENA